MWSFAVVVLQPIIQIGLKRLQVLVDLFTEGHLVKFLQYRFVEPFADTIGLWRFDLRFGVVNIVHGQV